MKGPWIVVATFVAIVVTAAAFGNAASVHDAPPSDTTRLVGRGQFVVEVPADWAIGEPQCDGRFRPTVKFWYPNNGGDLFRCFEIPSSFVEIGPLKVAGNELPARRGGREYYAVLTSKRDDAWILVSSDDRKLADRIAASAHRLPKGWTTVPALASGLGCDPSVNPERTMHWWIDDWMKCLSQRGLVPRVGYGGGPQRPVSREISPREGTALKRGSTVRIKLPSRDSPTRLVGRGRFVVAVPRHWATADERCGTPMSSTVLFWHRYVQLCAIVNPHHYDTLTIQPFAEPVGPAPVGYARRIVASKIDDARLIIDTRSPVLAAQVAASAHRLSRRWTTVPALTNGDGCGPWPRSFPAGFDVHFYTACLERHGLKAQSRRGQQPRNTPALTSTPAEGSPVRIGGTVRILLPPA